MRQRIPVLRGNRVLAIAVHLDQYRAGRVHLADGDRGLHCVAYYAPTGQLAGATVTGSIKGTGK